jgi:hypothetical protein
MVSVGDRECKRVASIPSRDALGVVTTTCAACGACADGAEDVVAHAHMR